MGKKPQPAWHLHDDLHDCGSHRWLFVLDPRTVVLVDEPNRSLLQGAEPRPTMLESRPFDLLMVLLRRHPQGVTRDELRALLWGDRAVGRHVIPKCASKLRLALGTDGVTGPAADFRPPVPWLVAVYGNGYRLHHPPHRLPRPPAPGEEAPSARERRHARKRLDQWLAGHRYPPDLPAPVRQSLAGCRTRAQASIMVK